MLKKVLLVEDDPTLLEIIQEILGQEGYEVRGLGNTDNIIKTVIEHQPDLVLLDYILPGVNGGELCAQLKKTAQTSHLPVIILTAYSKVLLSLGNYGCDEYIAKPFDINDLIKAVDRFAGNSCNKDHYA